MKKIAIFVVSIVTFFSACTKEISLKIPDEGRKITLNCFFSSDSTFSVSLTQSRFILDVKYDFPILTHAEVFLYENDMLFEQLLQGNSANYTSKRKPEAGKTYKVIVREPQLGQAMAFNSIPEKPIAFVADTFTIQINSGNALGYDQQNYALKVKIRIVDPTGKNYYLIKMTKKQLFIDKNNVEKWYENDVMFHTDDLTIDENNYLNNEVVFSDEYFESKTYDFPAIIEKTNLGFINNNEKLMIRVSSISEAYYKYVKSLIKFASLNFTPFKEPVMVFNNIENGIGIFAGYNNTIDSVAYK